MITPTPVLKDLSPAERAASIAEAAGALQRGQLVVMPTETVYGLAANAASPLALERLAGLTGRGQPGRISAWHAHGPDVVREITGLEHPIHRRLLRRLAPGPVTFLIERPEDHLAAICERLGIARGVVENGSELAVRIPDHAVAHALLANVWEQSASPVIAEGLGAAGWGSGATAAEAHRRIAQMPDGQAPVGAILDDGPTRFGRASTSIRLTADGSYAVLYEGVLEERFIRKKLDRTILFVCSGNTCRSPMAEAIARHMLESQPPPIATRVRSAGISAYDGAPPSPEAVEALRAMGIAMGRHASRELTRQMIAEADVIFAMTPAHAEAVASIDPSATGKVHTIDPEGLDVPDPFGQSPEIYRQTAERLREIIERRLRELEP